ncbi:MAG: hypothetical protein ACRERE_12165 [Candidatus Entotheonellia bacterium]
MSTSNQQHQVRLEVRPARDADTATEIFVIDGQFNLASRGRGRLETQLDPGIYTVKCRAGEQLWEQHVILRDRDEQVVIPPFNFVSSAPLVDTAQTHEYHMAAAEAQSRVIHVAAGQGSWIFVFVRDWTASRGKGTRAERVANPARGLSLRDARGKVVADLATSSTSNPDRDPWAACNVQVNPGLYRLSLQRPAGSRLEQMVVASPGWQTQIFLMQRADGPEPDDKCADLVDGSIFLSRGPGFMANSVEFRRAELARLGLTGQRRVLSEDIYELLRGKLENPMLGLYGAHLLLLEKQPDLDLLRTAVAHLRALLSTPHPDVEALALLVKPAGSHYVFREPPMLRQSWSLLVEATATRPDLVPPDSLAANVSDDVWGEGPWLIWLERSEEASSDLEEMLESHLRPRQRSEGAPRPARRADSPFAALRRRLSAHIQMDAFESPQPSVPPASVPETRLDAEKIEKLVRILGLPRATVEQLLDKIERRRKNTP